MSGGTEPMATVRRRRWTTAAGEQRESWICDYFDAGGTRRQRTFDKKSEARDWLDQVKVDVKAGVHVPDRASVTIATAADQWLEFWRDGSPDGEHDPLEPGTTGE